MKRASAVLDLDKRDYDRKLRQAAQDAEKRGKQLRQSFGKMRDAILPVTVAIGGTAGLVVALGKLSQAGSRSIAIQEAFASRTGDATGSLEMLRAATHGLIGDVDLMTQANVALTMGAAKNAEEFANLARTTISTATSTVPAS